MSGITYLLEYCYQCPPIKDHQKRTGTEEILLTLSITFSVMHYGGTGWERVSVGVL